MAIPLDELDRQLLYELDKDSAATFVLLSKRLGVPNETVGFRVRRLIDQGIIKNFRTTVHVSRLNAYYYKFFFKFQQTTKEKEDEIVGYLKDHAHVAYLASLEGRYDITFLVVAQSYLDLKEFLLPFKERFGAYLLEQEILTMTAVHRFNFRFFYSNGAPLHTSYPEALTSVSMSSLDWEILAAVAADSRTKFTELAHKHKVHPNVIRYRLGRLQKIKVVGTPVLDIDFNKLGVQHYQIDFALRNQKIVQEMINYALTFPESTFATVTLGKYDLVLEFAVPNIARLNAMLAGLKERFADSVMNHDVFVLHEHTVNWLPSSLLQEKNVKTKQSTRRIARRH